MRLAWMMLVGVSVLAMHAHAQEQVPLKTQRDKVNYAIGVNLAANFRQQGVEIDPDLVARGMKDALSGGKLLLPDEDVRKYVSQYQAAVRQMQAAKGRTITEEGNRKEGKSPLADNKTKEGVVTLSSGLQYSILKSCHGKKPTDADTVEFNYRSTLINGTEVDSSYRTGVPAVFKVSEAVVPGLSEALKLMTVGSRWKIFIPPQLAYGEKGRDRDIGPNATLIFEVELLAIK